MITYIDPKNRYGFANKLTETWFGRPHDKLIGEEASNMFGAKDNAKLAPYRDRVLAGETLNAQETIAYPDGVTRDIDFTYVPEVGVTIRQDGRQLGPPLTGQEFQEVFWSIYFGPKTSLTELREEILQRCK